MRLPLLDIIVLIAYLSGTVGLGCFLVRRSRSAQAFMVARRALPGWVVGLSIFGTYLSSNTFIGVPGRAFGANWNFFVFSLSLPIAAAIAVRWFVPFYRGSDAVSAYDHLERRFGPWARTYGVIIYLLTQMARTAAILFAVAVAMRALLGWDMATIILATGVLVTLYTLLGGIEAVIWTDVLQSIVLTAGALAAVAVLIAGMPGGAGELVAMAAAEGKFSLGGFAPSVSKSTFWVVLLYGLFINLSNFGIDQNYVQRYFTARSHQAAARSVWIGALAYVPVSLLFFFIGSALFSWYSAHPQWLAEVRQQVAAERLEAKGVERGGDYSERLRAEAEALTPADVGDKVFPHFIVRGLPAGVTGLVLAAIFAAAMSTIDSSLNSSATVFLADIYKRYLRKDAGEAESMRVLRGATVVWGALGTSAGLAMIGIQSVLEAWWQLQGVLAGGLLGLFLLGLLSRSAGNAAAASAVMAGVLVIGWMTLSPRIPQELLYLRSPFHSLLTIVVGTMVILAVGLTAGRIKRWKSRPVAEQVAAG